MHRNCVPLSAEVSDYDAMVTDEWRSVTKGNTDSDAMNTIFLCIAAGMPPRPVITQAEAKTAVQTIRRRGAGRGRGAQAASARWRTLPDGSRIH